MPTANAVRPWLRRSAPALYRFINHPCPSIANMNALELKVPPPLVALAVALAMWMVSTVTPAIAVDFLIRAIVAVGVALLGGAIGAAGNIAFRLAKTTVNPMKPEKASSLVTVGIYRFTRNPMYVGLLLVLVGWQVFLAAPWALVGPLAFAAYITRFQITPEERVLASLFGAAYGHYKARVRRWL